MNVETLQLMSRITLIIAVAAFLAAALMFFLFHIPRLFSELTGRAEKKFIADAKKKNFSESELHSGTSENLLSSGSVSETSAHPAEQPAVTVILSKETTVLSEKEFSRDTESKDEDFFIIETFSFTSSKEIIE